MIAGCCYNVCFSSEHGINERRKSRAVGICGYIAGNGGEVGMNRFGKIHHIMKSYNIAVYIRAVGYNRIISSFNGYFSHFGEIIGFDIRRADITEL